MEYWSDGVGRNLPNTPLPQYSKKNQRNSKTYDNRQTGHGGTPVCFTIVIACWLSWINMI